MKRGRRALLILCGGVLLAIVVWVAWPGEREPEYQGKKLSEWLDLYKKSSRGSADRESASTAIRMMSEQVIPIAIRAIRNNDPPEWKKRLRTLTFKGRKWLPKRMISWLWAEPGERGALCFNALGTNGVAGIAELEKIATRADVQPSCFQALQAIGWTGRASLPALTRISTNQSIHIQVRRSAIASVGDFWTNAIPFLPALRCGFTDPEPLIRQETTNTFTRIGVASGPTLRLPPQ